VTGDLFLLSCHKCSYLFKIKKINIKKMHSFQPDKYYDKIGSMENSRIALNSLFTDVVFWDVVDKEIVLTIQGE
jgi:hypothetical protein